MHLRESAWEEEAEEDYSPCEVSVPKTLYLYSEAMELQDHTGRRARLNLVSRVTRKRPKVLAILLEMDHGGAKGCRDAGPKIRNELGGSGIKTEDHFS